MPDPTVVDMPASITEVCELTNRPRGTLRCDVRSQSGETSGLRRGRTRPT